MTVWMRSSWYALLPALAVMDPVSHPDAVHRVLFRTLSRDMRLDYSSLHWRYSHTGDEETYDESYDGVDAMVCLKRIYTTRPRLTIDILRRPLRRRMRTMFAHVYPTAAGMTEPTSVNMPQ